MIPGRSTAVDEDPRHAEQHRRLFDNAWALVFPIAVTEPTANTLPVGFAQLFDDGHCQRLYYNATGTVLYWALTPPGLGSPQTLAASGVITPAGEWVRVAGQGGAVTLTTTPCLLDGQSMQRLYLKGTSNTNTVTLTNGTGVRLQASNRTLGLNDVLALYFDPETLDWHELFLANL